MKILRKNNMGELDTFYNLLNDFDPSMIGGKLPNDGLYYAG